MKPLFTVKQGGWLAVLLVIGFVAVFLHAGPKPTAKRKAVLVELFTSEGCSSCPPADALLGELGGSRSGNGAEIITLGFHVDYWNYQGWQDRFSSHAYSERQNQYAQRFQEEPYTPQLVVDGESQLVGSDSAGAESAIIRAAAMQQLTDVRLTWQSQDKLRVEATSADGASTAQVLLVITEDDLTTKVGGGENNGRVLHHSAVVRELRVLGHMSNGRFAADAPVKPASDWKLKDLRFVAFVQPAPVGPIEGVAAISLAPATAKAAVR